MTTTPFDWLAWLRRIACRTTISLNMGDLCCHPWRIDAAGKPWTVATDGRVIVYLDGGLKGVTYPEAAQRSEREEQLLRHWEPAAPQVWSGSIDLLKQWVEPPLWKVLCPVCLGRSKTSEYLYCSFCDGDGDMDPDARFGWLFGQLIDRELVARALEGATGEAVTVYLDAAKLDVPVWFVGKDFRAAVMPMTPRAGPPGADPKREKAEKEAPRFEG